MLPVYCSQLLIFCFFTAGKSGNNVELSASGNNKRSAGEDYASKKTVDEMAHDLRNMNKKFKANEKDLSSIKEMLSTLLANQNSSTPSQENISTTITHDSNSQTIGTQSDVSRPNTIATGTSSTLTMPSLATPSTSNLSGGTNPNCDEFTNFAELNPNNLNQILHPVTHDNQAFSGSLPTLLLPHPPATTNADMAGHGLGYVAPAGLYAPGSLGMRQQGPIMSESLQYQNNQQIRDNKITIHIPDSVRRKIQEGKYVDMSELIQNQDAKSSQPGAMLASALGMSDFISEPKKNKIKDIQTWAKAFTKFKFFHTEYYPSDARALDLYMFHVLDLASDFADWELFDSEFRKERAAANGKRQWDDYHSYLYNKAYAKAPRNVLPFRGKWGQGRDVNYPPAGSGLARKPRADKFEIPPGHCFQYHSSGKFCHFAPNCKYDHRCPKCKLDHPLCKHGYAREMQARDDSAPKKKSA